MNTEATRAINIKIDSMITGEMITGEITIREMSIEEMMTKEIIDIDQMISGKHIFSFILYFIR